MSKSRSAQRGLPPVAVIFGDEEFQKTEALRQLLDELLPAEVDRGMALCEYDGTQTEELGGPSLAAVMDDLRTLPFLADRRVVVVREADKFITAHRPQLERYCQAPAERGVLVLCCRSFPKTTKLYKSVAAVGGRLIECKKLSARGLLEFVRDQARKWGKQMDPAVAARLLDLVGSDQGLLASEVEKLCLYAAARRSITLEDLSELVGLSREEKVFAVMDAAGAGRPDQALRLWHQVTTTDPAAVYKAAGGIAFKLRSWLNAHQLIEQGLPLSAVAPKVMMWRRERELGAILRRLPPTRIKRTLAALAELDAQAKSGARSIDNGVEALLLDLAG